MVTDMVIIITHRSREQGEKSMSHQESTLDLHRKAWGYSTLAHEKHDQVKNNTQTLQKDGKDGKKRKERNVQVSNALKSHSLS